ncbi:MAG: EAL domain-containing protein [Deltaproteobacteria bacterium]|nr:EAL domain-containing protein [Deltaproteobacteria bacterium]
MDRRQERASSAQIEPPEVARLRHRLALSVTYLTGVTVLALLALSYAGVAITLSRPALWGLLAGNVAVAVFVAKAPVLGRNALPVLAAFAIAFVTPDPYVHHQVAPSLFLPAIFALLVADDWLVGASLFFTIAGFVIRGGVRSPYLHPELLVVASLAAVVLVAAHRLRLGLYTRLAMSERRTRAIAAATDDVVLILRPDGAVLKPTFVGEASKRVLGREPDEIAAMTLRELVHGEDRARVGQVLDDVRAGEPHPVAVEFRAMHSDGDPRWVNARVINMLSDPDVAGVLITLRDVTEVRHVQQELERRLAHQALHDPLTGLANRRLLLEEANDRLAALREGGAPFCLLFCDLDRFKVVNDSLGHEVGDRLLADVAARLISTLRPDDLASRFGGDEFVILLPSTTADAAYAIASRIVDAFRAPFEVAKQKLHLQVSVGVVAARAGHETAESILRDADVAMYRAKEAGRDRAEVFEPEMGARVSRRHELEQSLRRAIAQRELTVHYQPKYRLRDGAIDGFEALVRWTDPLRGTIGPNEFVPLAEETGLVVPLGLFVLEEACRWFIGWRREHDVEEARIAVNLSGRQLQDPGLADDISRVLAHTGIDPSCVQLEVTESVAMTNAAANIETLRQLRGLGPSIAVDDFGTGYSSLAYLRRLPVDTLKIDRAFIASLERGSEDESIVRFLLSLAKTLGLRTVAEGIETADQLEVLADLGCDAGQGFLLGRPSPAAEALRVPLVADIPGKSLRRAARALRAITTPTPRDV